MMTSKNTDENLDQSSPDDNIPIIEIKSLKKYFPVQAGAISRIFSKDNVFVHAVDDISFSIAKGEIFCLVGESGCGKTTTARIVAGLEPETSGEVIWKGDQISFDELKTSKGNVKTQIVFQNPYSSLSPRLRLGEAAQHPLVVHDKIEDPKTRKTIKQAYYSETGLLVSFIVSVVLFLTATIRTDESSTWFTVSGFVVIFSGIGAYIWLGRIQKGKLSDDIVQSIFDLVGLAPPDQYYNKYPHEVSGGERQRVAIARSVVLNPQLLILDEPTSMLDVSLRAGILDLLLSIKEKFEMSILFITHDLATARHFGDRISVMYAGKIVETGTVDELFNNPMHPYTRALIDAIPSPTPRDIDVVLPKGDVPDSINPPPGCRFYPRCIYAQDKCSIVEPETEELIKDHFVACYYPLNVIK